MYTYFFHIISKKIECSWVWLNSIDFSVRKIPVNIKHIPANIRSNIDNCSNIFISELA